MTLAERLNRADQEVNRLNSNFLSAPEYENLSQFIREYDNFIESRLRQTKSLFLRIKVLEKRLSSL